MNITVKHRENMSFEASSEAGHKIIMDATENFGGNNQGMLPKELVLAGLLGCTGMDVVSLLNKMRVSFDDFYTTCVTELSEDHPKIFTKIHIIYHFSGADIDKSKVERAINLSQEKYCGVSAMLKKSSEIAFSIKYH